MGPTKINANSDGSGLECLANILFALVNKVRVKLFATIALNFLVQRIKQSQHGGGNDCLLHGFGGKLLGFLKVVCCIVDIAEWTLYKFWKLTVVFVIENGKILTTWTICKFSTFTLRRFQKHLR